MPVKLNSEANDHRFGDVLRADVGGHWRAYPARYERCDQVTVNLVAELNGVWAGRDRFDGDPDGDSGGSKLFLTPGLQVIASERLLFEAAGRLQPAGGSRARPELELEGSGQLVQLLAANSERQQEAWSRLSERLAEDGLRVRGAVHGHADGPIALTVEAFEEAESDP